MSTLMDLFGEMSSVVKLAWAGWFVWVAIQIVWFRRARIRKEPEVVFVRLVGSGPVVGSAKCLDGTVPSPVTGHP